MSYGVINFSEKFGLIEEQWQPKAIAEMNDYQFKLVRLQAILFGTTTRKRMRRSS
jgi:hypothetical protein